VNVEAFAQQLASGTSALPTAFGIALLGGLVAGLGPCILPMLPAVFGYVTGTVAEEDIRGQRGSAYLRSLSLIAVFVLGMSILFATIGAVAGLLGHAILVGTWAYYAVAAICVALGLHMLGVVSLPFDALSNGRSAEATWAPCSSECSSALWRPHARHRFLLRSRR
jgi:cytochrome c biogenesis protein CcdA